VSEYFCIWKLDFLFDFCDLMPLSAIFQQYFSYIMATSFSGGRSRSTRREPPTMGKQLVNVFVEYTLFVIYKVGREPTPYCLVVRYQNYIICIANANLSIILT